MTTVQTCGFVILVALGCIALVIATFKCLSLAFDERRPIPLIVLVGTLAILGVAMMVFGGCA